MEESERVDGGTVGRNKGGKKTHKWCEGGE